MYGYYRLPKQRYDFVVLKETLYQIMYLLLFLLPQSVIKRKTVLELLAYEESGKECIYEY